MTYSMPNDAVINKRYTCSSHIFYMDTNIYIYYVKRSDTYIPTLFPMNSSRAAL